MIFDTSYYYIPDSDEILPNYDLYDIFSLRTNLSNLYPNYDIIFKDVMNGNKMFLTLVINDKIGEQERVQISSQIDEFSGPSRLYVILFPFDSKVKNIPTYLSN